MSLSAWIPGTRAWARRREGDLCQRTVERVQEIVDGEIGPGRAEQLLALHLEACQHCDAEAEVFRQLKTAIARVSSEPDPGAVRNLEELASRLCRGEHPE